VKSPNPQPPVAAYFFESLTITCIKQVWEACKFWDKFWEKDPNPNFSLDAFSGAAIYRGGSLVTLFLANNETALKENSKVELRSNLTPRQ